MSTTNQQQSQLLLEKYNDTLKNIQDLQAMEKYMFENLEKLNSGESDDIQRQKEVVDKINELSTMRMSLFNQLKDSYIVTSSELKDSKNLVSDKKVMIDMVEHELNETKKRIMESANIHDTQLRKIQIGNYQNDRTRAINYILKVISFTLVIVFLLSLAHNFGILPSTIYSTLVVLVVSGSIIYMIYLGYDIYSRDNFNFNQYKFSASGSETEMQPGYETVLQHDELFFKDIGSGLMGDFNQAKQDIQNKMSGLSKLGNTMGSSLEKDASSLENAISSSTSNGNIKNSNSSKNQSNQINMSSIH